MTGAEHGARDHANGRLHFCSADVTGSMPLCLMAGRRSVMPGLDKCGPRLRLLGAGGKSSREHGDLLNLGRQWSDQIDARHRDELAHLLKADLEFAARNGLADRVGRDRLALALELFRNTETRNSTVDR